MFEIVYNNKPVNDFVVDVVITYVDPTDPEWLKTFSDAKQDPNKNCRYRHWNTLQYLFRGIETYMPWIRKIHLVVASLSQVPTWLNKHNPMLNIVCHSDFMPEELLPTFSSLQIEMFLYRIAGLADHFVCFNDDMFPLKPLSKDAFFTTDGKARTNLGKWTHSKSKTPFFRMLQNGINLLHKDYPGYKGYANDHFTYNLIKPLFAECVNKYIEPIMTTFKQSRFRTKDDISLQLIRDYQAVNGMAAPSNITKFYVSLVDGCTIPNSLKEHIACFNDTEALVKDFNRVEKELIHFFDRLLPNKSSFEL